MNNEYFFYIKYISMQIVHGGSMLISIFSLPKIQQISCFGPVFLFDFQSLYAWSLM